MRLLLNIGADVKQVLWLLGEDNDEETEDA